MKNLDDLIAREDIEQARAHRACEPAIDFAEAGLGTVRWRPRGYRAGARA